MEDSSEQTANQTDEDGSVDDTAPDGGVRAKAAWAWQTNREPVATARDIVVGFAIAAAIAAILLSFSGVWPPFFAVTSSSMEPNLNQGDLVLVADTDKYVPPETAADTNIVTREIARDGGYTQFNGPGDVIIYRHPTEGYSIIHRAEFHVEEGENWYDRANPKYLGAAQNCRQLANCPAPHDGFITKGDNNPKYDQVGTQPISPPVKEDWIRAKGLLVVPYVGYIRLVAGGIAVVGGVATVLFALREIAGD